MYVFLTEQGRNLQGKLEPLAIEVNALSMQSSSDEDIQTTRKVLLRIIENLAADEAQNGLAERKMLSTRKLGGLVSRSTAAK